MKLFALLSLLLVSSAWARMDSEILMASITSNIDTDTGRFFLITDENGDVDSVRYTITQRGGAISQDDTHTWESVRDGGVVLVKRDGREVIRLGAEAKFSPKTGGVINVTYLYSGVTNAWKTLALNLKRLENGSFGVFNGTKPVNSMMVYGNWKVIIGLVGIADITTSYKAPFLGEFNEEEYDYSSSLK